jgi:hypothetical protein
MRYTKSNSVLKKSKSQIQRDEIIAELEQRNNKVLYIEDTESYEYIIIEDELEK